MCDPLTQLRIQGFLCPCTVSEEDHVARVAALTIQGVPIRWHREVRNDASTTNAASPASASASGATTSASASATAAFWSSHHHHPLKEKAPPPGNGGNDLLEPVVTNFNRGVNRVAKALRLDEPPPQVHLTSYVGIDATLSVVSEGSGSDGGHPSIRVVRTSISTTDPRDFHDFCDDDDANCGSDKVGTKRTAASKTVALRDISEISPGDGLLNQRGRLSCGVRIHVFPPLSSLSASAGAFGVAFGRGKKVLMFDVLESAVHGVTRDEVVRHLNDLVAWDRRRRTMPPKVEKVEEGGGDFVLMGGVGGGGKRIGEE